jgi:hypothetical protein
LVKINTNLESRLEREYPFGYAMIALSGHKKVILPPVKRLDVNWDNLKVHTDGRNMIWIDIYELKDSSERIISECSLGVKARPGATSKGFRFGNTIIQAECVKAGDVGVFVVLGLKEIPEESTSQKKG